jgi:hypothetical protein
MNEQELNETLQEIENLERGYKPGTGTYQFSREEINFDKGTAGSYHISRAKALDVSAFSHVLPDDLKEKLTWGLELMQSTRRVPRISVDGGFEGYQNADVEAQTAALRNHIIANPEDEKNLAKAVLLVNDYKLGKKYDLRRKTHEAVDVSKLTDRQRKFARVYFYNADVNQPRLRRNLNYLIRTQGTSNVPEHYNRAAMASVIGEMDAVNVSVRGRKRVSAGLVNRVAFLQDRFAGIDNTSYDFTSTAVGEAETFINTRRNAARMGYEALKIWYEKNPPPFPNKRLEIIDIAPDMQLPESRPSLASRATDIMNPFSRIGEKM